MIKKIHLFEIFIGGFFLFLDQFVKHFFLTHQTFSFYIFKPWLGLEYFENPGIAFGIPLPNVIVLVFTPLVILLILLLLFKPDLPMKRALALCLILGGAVSNFTDRIFFDFTVDYIRVLTSILNIADIMIVLGAFLIIQEELSQQKS